MNFKEVKLYVFHLKYIIIAYKTKTYIANKYIFMNIATFHMPYCTQFPHLFFLLKQFYRG